jgi:hypothetical protein
MGLVVPRFCAPFVAPRAKNSFYFSSTTNVISDRSKPMCSAALFSKIAGHVMTQKMLMVEKGGPDFERLGVIRTQGGVLREFQTWLKNKDPGFGDLRKVLNKQKEFLWVHRDYEKEY